MKLKHTLAVLAFTALGFAAAPVWAQQIHKETVPGVTNLSLVETRRAGSGGGPRVETTVGCAGATSSEAMPAIKKLGFTTVINLRQASEAGANVPTSEAAAKAAGLKYISLTMER